MELPPLTQTPLSSVSSSKQLKSVALSAINTNAEGLRLSANIESSHRVSDAAKQQLRQQLSNHNTGSYAALTALTNDENLVLIKLRIYQLEGRAASPTNLVGLSSGSSEPSQMIGKGSALSIFTNQNLPTTSTLILEVRKDGHLQLIQALGINSNKPAGVEPSMITTSADITGNGATESPNKWALKALEQGYRQYLPFERSMTNPSTILQKTLEHLQQLPPQQRQMIIEKPLLKALQQWAAANPLEKGRLTSTRLQALLNNSGVFFEQKLMTAVQQSQTNHNLPLPAQGLATTLISDNKALLLTILNHTSPLGQTQASSPSTNAPSKQPPQPLAPAPSSINGNSFSPHSALLTADKPDGQNLLQSSLQNAASQLRGLDSLLSAITALQQSAKSYSNAPNLKKQLARLISSAAAVGIAKISMNQLKQLSRSLNDSNGLPSLHIDIPVKIQEQTIPLSLSLTEYPYEEETSDHPSNESNNKTVKARWQVYLEIYLEEWGCLAVEIMLQDKQLKTRFWADSNTLQERAKLRIDKLKTRLTAKGLEIDEIRFEDGSPPNKKQKISHSLVDIKT